MNLCSNLGKFWKWNSRKWIYFQTLESFENEILENEFMFNPGKVLKMNLFSNLGKFWKWNSRKWIYVQTLESFERVQHCLKSEFLYGVSLILNDWPWYPIWALISLRINFWSLHLIIPARAWPQRDIAEELI